MIRRTQHSASPSAQVYSTPPVSPTITHVSSRSHTPSHSTDVHDPSHEVPLRSQSPPRSPSPPPSKPAQSMMGSRPGGAHDNNERPSATATAVQRPVIPSSMSAPAGRLPRLLPADLSHYTDAYLPTAAIPTSSTSLAELAHLIRLQGYQEQRKAHSRVRLHRWLVSSALSARLVHCGELAHRTLVDSFRSDDKKSFATLFHALHDVRNSCDATRRYALLEPDLELGKSKSMRNEKSQSFSTFMNEVPSKILDDLLDFISEIRTNPDFLATRILNLSQQELASLTTFRQSLDPIDSVMAMQARGKAVGSSHKPNQPQGPTPIERLLSFQRHDPLAALIYTIFANSSGPDSAEDLRRTDAWATTCAKLITAGKPGCDKFIIHVLDAFAGMREWPGKANLELYLMQVLQDGQFLLEKAEEQSARPASQPVARSTKDTIAADDFYDKAVKRLFEVVDDEPSAGGIPEGVLEIGNAILRKMEESGGRRAGTRTFIVSRWLFSTYLLNAIIHPESHGIMIGHHISEHARQKILKEIAIRAQKHVLDMTYNWKQGVPILPEIRVHIDNILARFKHSKSNSKPVLLPAKAITSPRETVEVQPFIVVCPSDIITLVNTLFPERRPPSSHFEKDLRSRTGLTSSASSISGISMPFRPSSISAGDASSILSQSASSMTSDTTSREPLLDSSGQPIDRHTLPPEENYIEKAKIAPTEDYGRRLRMACSEMSRILGMDACSGSCHPCAERWAVLYISPDGKHLKPRMRKDADDEDEHDDDSPESDSSDDEGASDRLDLESDYHQLKEAIAKLVEEYEIPKELAPESESKNFSNRTSTHRRDSRGGRAARRDGDSLGSRNPYNSQSQSQLTNLIASQRNIQARHRSPQQPRSSSNPQPVESQDKTSVLVTMLEAAMYQCQARSDFVNAHLYYKTLQTLRKLTSPSLIKNGYAALLNYFCRGPRDSLGKSASAIEEFEAWFVWLKQSQERHDAAIEEMMMALKNLRDKMWYITDVRNSAGYEEAKNVAIALKIMGQPTRTLDGKPIQTNRPRNFSKSSTNNFLLKTEAQVVDIMAAPQDFGGPNKLSDEQSDITLKWLNQYSVENFCKGEERIHRFCLEVDKCVNKLVGDGMMDGPVLWSSELYRRDKEVLDSGRQKGDLFLTGVGTLSIAGDEEYETQGRPVSRSLDFAQRPSQSSLRSISNRNGSQQSFDSSPWGRNLMDSQDYFGGHSPVLTIDSTATFWSPFQTQAQSPTSATSIRPRTASSSKGTVMLKQSASVNEDKRRFLLDLKQTLTGLLLSDLGTMVFGHGSETDAWFSGDLGEDCLHRKEEEERRRKRQLARKKSMKNIRNATRSDTRNGPLETLGRNERSQAAPPVATLQHAAASDPHHSASEHSTSSDATSRSTGMAAAKKAGLLEFPYNVAFRRLLNKFATHPNPFSKLHALYELELLIIASLSSRSGRSYNNRRDTLPAVPQSPTLGAMPELSSRQPAAQVSRAQNLEEAIANCEERRSHSMTNLHGAGTASPLPHRSGTRSPVGPPSTDMIVEVLQGLFRDPDIRPKTLFRDLQFIASFVPAQMLDKTARGKAFWDVGLAALGLKQDVCRIMVEIVDDIVAQNSKRDPIIQQQNGSASQQPGTASVSSSAPSIDEPSSRYTMEDAARMLLITAREGDAVAERELAIFYLTSPELLQRAILPLTKPRDVFKTELLNRDRKASGDTARSDPMTMCVAQHWMEQSKRGGDQLATKYLRARDELDRIS
ncbi:uncharacterized protein BDR25DRAFT_91094 [Lindgomyces ingoldianus]|uniref:Uncharacterized protein n=1 Tax=Lindgomyces ingoldianus TaxID=673940 RepID=A0ACB6QF77_9PLEO|nr:uncharacterized protein BDR25DRAFT_91094 [Lindgomyces ingoldianus]KAF2465145.1 hypothetical protein BDR25DRAFT_91094 [Lindgomyces ingoldianus]